MSMIKLTFSAIVKALVVSTEIGFSWDEGSVGGGSSAWDVCPTPKADWDAMLDNCEENGIRKLNISLRKVWIVHLSSWWSCPMESFSSSGFLSYPWNHFALWRLTCHDHGSSMGSHQLLQRRCGWSHPWNWAWRLVIYRTPSPILA